MLSFSPSGSVSRTDPSKMAAKTARCRPTLSCLKTHKLRRRTRRSTDTTSLATNLTKKPKVVNKVDRIAAVFQSSMDLVGHLCTVLPPTDTSLIHEVLIRLLLRQDNTLRPKVTDHARRQLRTSNNIHQVIDWTDLDVPANISEAVWQFHCIERI